MTPGDLDDLKEEALRWQNSEEVIFAVQDAMEGATVDPKAKRIIWPDGAVLSVKETAARIHASEPELPLEQIQAHLVGWLETEYVPEGLSDTETEKFEALMERWVDLLDQKLDRTGRL